MSREAGARRAPTSELMTRSQHDTFLLEARLLRDRVDSFDVYPFSLPDFRGLDALELHPRVTFLVGENGSGKSTLLEAIAVACGLNPEGGSRNFRFGTRESHSTLHEVLRLSRTIRTPRDSYFLRAETFYNVATELERLDEGPAGELTAAYGGRSLHEQSHGEAFFALFENRFRGRGLYLLDEPESALSPSRQLSFLTILHRLCREDSQFLIATHSPILLAYPEATIYLLEADGLKVVPYVETEHYRIARAFLTRTEAMLSVLLENETGG